MTAGDGSFMEETLENIQRQKRGIKKVDCETGHRHRAVVIWLTGLPCSGKTTIANEIKKRLFQAGAQIVVFDGDIIRKGLNKDLGFSAEDRSENIRRIGEVAKLFTGAGFIVVTAFISPYRKDRDQVRILFDDGDFIEVYLKADIEICKRRDVKGLYKKAMDGKIPDFTGISAPYEEPLHPEIIVNTDKLSVAESINKIISYLAVRKIIKSTQ